MADESKYPTRIAPYGLRMPDDLKARVQAAAEAHGRSMNAEIVATLEREYPIPLTRLDVEHYLGEWFDGLNDEDQGTVAEYLLSLRRPTPDD